MPSLAQPDSEGPNDATVSPPLDNSSLRIVREARKAIVQEIAQLVLDDSKVQAAFARLHALDRALSLGLQQVGSTPTTVSFSIYPSQSHGNGAAPVSYAKLDGPLPVVDTTGFEDVFDDTEDGGDYAGEVTVINFEPMVIEVPPPAPASVVDVPSSEPIDAASPKGVDSGVSPPGTSSPGSGQSSSKPEYNPPTVVEDVGLSFEVNAEFPFVHIKGHYNVQATHEPTLPKVEPIDAGGR